MEVILYTSHCPKCKVLELKLQKKKIEYKEVDIKPDNIEELLSQGIRSAPCLKVDGELMEFSKALQYINKI